MNVERVALSEIEGLRDVYRHEMNCQIIHDSIHFRAGWSEEYVIYRGASRLGYGSVAVAGPWKDKPALYEFFLLPQYRNRMFDAFLALLSSCGSTEIETQSNDPLLTAMLHTFASPAASEAILFRDELTTHRTIPGAEFRPAMPEDTKAMAQQELDPDAKWLVTFEGTVAAAGDILFHYNRPYGDIYMAVGEPFRRRGLGSFLVQELKRVCYEGGSVPAARCNISNAASRQTLQRAGFVPCGHILHGTVSAVFASTNRTPQP